MLPELMVLRRECHMRLRLLSGLQRVLLERSLDLALPRRVLLRLVRLHHMLPVLDLLAIDVPRWGAVVHDVLWLEPVGRLDGDHLRRQTVAAPAQGVARNFSSNIRIPSRISFHGPVILRGGGRRARVPSGSGSSSTNNTSSRQAARRPAHQPCRTSRRRR